MDIAKIYKESTGSIEHAMRTAIKHIENINNKSFIVKYANLWKGAEMVTDNWQKCVEEIKAWCELADKMYDTASDDGVSSDVKSLMKGQNQRILDIIVKYENE